jgi:hypothetical protein
MAVTMVSERTISVFMQSSIALGEQRVVIGRQRNCKRIVRAAAWEGIYPRRFATKK